MVLEIVSEQSEHCNLLCPARVLEIYAQDEDVKEEEEEDEEEEEEEDEEEDDDE